MSEEIVNKNNKIPQPDPNIPWQAMIMIKAVVSAPLDNGMWQLVHSFDDNFNIVLDAKTYDESIEEVLGQIKKIKDEWESQEKIIALKSMLEENLNKIREKNIGEESEIKDE